MTRRKFVLHVFVLLAMLLAVVWASSSVHAAPLPQEHAYQRVLRDHLATLTAKDFAHGVAAEIAASPAPTEPDDQYRNYMLTLMVQPLVGSKRGAQSVTSPARLFTLASIESVDAVLEPPAWPEALIELVQWGLAGNPYRDSRALRLRCFAAGMVNLIMLDDFIPKHENFQRSDWFAYQLVYVSAAYPGFRDLLPAEVQQAYETGVKRLAERVMQWGPEKEEPNMDMIAPVGLWYAARAVNEPAFTKAVDAYAEDMFTNPVHFHPAGYFLERGGIDMGYAGMTAYFASWAALASDWPFAKDAVDRMYRLRGYLILRDVDGKLTGPTAFNSRLGSVAQFDQWDWSPDNRRKGARDNAAAMVTDHAAQFIDMPSQEELAGAVADRASGVNHAIHETPIDSVATKANGYNTFLDADKIASAPWRWAMWKTWNFPVSVNPAYSFYRKGAYAHRAQLERDHSPMLKSPYDRGETFVRHVEDAFVFIRQPGFAAILHTGPVGQQEPDDGHHQFAGPLGLGGGQLAAFWTDAAGSVIQGRRSGMNWDKSFDLVEQWRTWPIHAVSGQTAEGKPFTSARIVKPAVVAAVDTLPATVQSSGRLPADQLGQVDVLTGQLEYARTFTIASDHLRVETRITGDGKDRLAELYETIPVFLGENQAQADAAKVTIDFESVGQWSAGDDKPHDNVTAVRINRFAGRVVIRFDKPQHVMLSSAVWQGTYMTRAICRNVMIDLLGSGDRPAPLNGQRMTAYRIESAAR